MLKGECGGMDVGGMLGADRPKRSHDILRTRLKSGGAEELISIPAGLALLWIVVRIELIGLSGSAAMSTFKLGKRESQKQLE
jgi:hypothetical protein